MYLKDQIHPTKNQLRDLAKNAPKDKPITMVNIIRFKSHVEEEKASGEDIYSRYSVNALSFLKEAGGKVIWKGTVQNTIIGSDEDMPHIIILVTYPSPDHFLNMISNPSYQKISKDRTISIEYGGLIATTEDYRAS